MRIVYWSRWYPTSHLPLSLSPHLSSLSPSTQSPCLYVPPTSPSFYAPTSYIDRCALFSGTAGIYFLSHTNTPSQPSPFTPSYTPSQPCSCHTLIHPLSLPLVTLYHTLSTGDASIMTHPLIHPCHTLTHPLNR